MTFSINNEYCELVLHISSEKFSDNYLNATPLKTKENKNKFNLSESLNFNFFSAKSNIEIKKNSKKKFNQCSKRKATTQDIEHPALDLTGCLEKGLKQMHKEGLNGCTLSHSYWIESTSRHHFAAPHYKKLQSLHTKSHSANLNFDDWVDTNAGQQAVQKVLKDEGYENITELKVAQLKAKERAQYKVEFLNTENGVILTHQGKPLNTNHFQTQSHQGKAIFVIGRDHELYIGNHEVTKFHHSSFFSGKPVIGAGEIITDQDGHLIAMTDKSGHYKPQDPQLIDTLECIQLKGINLNNITLIKSPKQVMSNGDIYYAGRFNAAEFLASKGKMKPEPNQMEDYF